MLSQNYYHKYELRSETSRCDADTHDTLVVRRVRDACFRSRTVLFFRHDLDTNITDRPEHRVDWSVRRPLHI